MPEGDIYSRSKFIFFLCPLPHVEVLVGFLPAFGVCQPGFLAALGDGNEQFQTSLPSHYSQGLLGLLLLLSFSSGSHYQRATSFIAGHGEIVVGCCGVCLQVVRSDGKRKAVCTVGVLPMCTACLNLASLGFKV